MIYGELHPHRPGRSWLRRLLTVCAGLLVLLLVFELGMRLFYPLESLTGYFDQATDGRAFRLKSNYSGVHSTKEYSVAVRTNDAGLRDDRPLVELTRAPGRVMCMGDSFAFGVGVSINQMYSTVLESLLQNEGSRCSVFSTGFDNGLGPVQYRFYVEKFFKTLQPDVVIVGLSPTTDFSDHQAIVEECDAQGKALAQRLVKLRVDGGKLVDTTVTEQQVRLRDWLHKRSLAFVFFDRALRRLFPSLEQEHETQASSIAPFFLQAEGLSRDNAIRPALQALLDMQRFLSERGKTLVVLYIPAGFQVSRAYFPTLEQFFQYDPQALEQAYTVEQPQTALGAFFSAQGIDWVDPTQTFKALEEKGYRLYSARDVHWTPEGHAACARLLATYLEEKRLAQCMKN